MKPICPYPHIRVSIVFLSVDLAKELLKSNEDSQRKVSKSNVAKIISDIQHDRFHPTGEPIIIGESKKMLDGQHRCIAVITAGKGIWTVLVEGINDEQFRVINTGKSRSLSDVLKIAGEKDTHNLAATLINLVRYLRSGITVGTNSPVTTSEAMDVLTIMPHARDSVRLCRTNRMKDVAAVSRVAWLHCVTQDWNKRRSDDFFTKLITGEMLSADDPIYLLRSRLTADRSSKSKLPTREMMALIVKAWNMHVTGKTGRILKWAETELFPELLLPDGNRVVRLEEKAS